MHRLLAALAIAACHAEAQSEPAAETAIDRRAREKAEDAALAGRRAADRFLFAEHRCPVNVEELLTAGYARAIPRDPWGAAIEIRCDGKGVDGISRGPDGTLGTTDDISAEKILGDAEFRMALEQKS